jgi:hypothetical protein
VAAEMIADKGYHSRDALKGLDGAPWRSRVSEPKRDESSRWHGDDAAQRAVYNNRARLLSGVARQPFNLRAELVERSFTLLLDRGGLRWGWPAWSGTHPQGIPDLHCWVQPGVHHATFDRRGNAPGNPEPDQSREI